MCNYQAELLIFVVKSYQGIFICRSSAFLISDISLKVQSHDCQWIYDSCEQSKECKTCYFKKCVVVIGEKDKI